MLLWHNTMVDPFDTPDQWRAYRRITEGLRGMNAWWATLAECVGAWKEFESSLET
ncbi:MAG: hypothetical protein ACYTAN_07120 [Planctomycetota bacterium]